ncbi:MBL fold metallo-hydrolase [Pseudoalteromonas sp. 2CM41L]|uniref:MBL fold metallo-hydrolase n=1 Tax=Pseudoalteromonas sp. 2CM41L TaxID=2929857 RepID=UPI0020C06A58|nr:MBL fold metallo-hydrolase [Pseudoalteromonas sp. 2CM41L]MCK8109050.1 MBL fold metallo-hydrolase [Pseudoalteromonas sp. 2CM41L]
MERQYYLKGSIYFEPLFNNWFMWPYLLAPAQAAMNLTNLHLRSMSSFVVNAKIHAKSLKSDAMVGSAFVNLPPERSGDVKALIEHSKSEHADLIEFTNAIRQLDHMLQSDARGLSLESMYEHIPEPLQGLVELHYDLNNQPSFRFIESLLYLTPIYKKHAQTVSLGNLASDNRPFVLSTPRLADDNHLHIKVPFDDAFTQTLFKSRETPLSEREIQALFDGLGCEGGLKVEELFTEEAPKKAESYLGAGLRITHTGHAGVLVESEGCNIMVDPVIAYKNDDVENKVTFEDLPPQIDYVLITHTHMDHLCLETLIQLKHKVKHIVVPKNNSGNLADPSMKLMLKELGFQSVLEVEDLEHIPVNQGHILSVPFLGEHADVNIRSKSAWLIQIQGKKVLVAADSSNLDKQLYLRLKEIIGDVDVLFIGMECTGGPLKWLYGGLLTQTISQEVNESRRFNGSDFAAASHLVDVFNPSQVYIYALGLEPWYKYFMGISYHDDDLQLVEARKLVNYCENKQRTSQLLSGYKQIIL